MTDTDTKTIQLDPMWTEGSAALTLATPEPADAPALNVRPTPAVALILGRIRYAVTERVPLCVVTGEHGSGKTTAATVYAERTPRALRWEVKPEYNSREIVADLCEHLGLQTGESWRVRTSTLIRYLQEHPHTILLDEAQRLDYRAMDMLKYIADSAKVTFVLLGSPWLDNRIDRHTDIASRAGVRVRVRALTLEEFGKVYAQDGYDAKTLKAIHEVTQGVMRRIDRLTRHLDVALADQPGMTRAALTPAHVRAVAEEVL